MTPETAASQLDVALSPDGRGPIGEFVVAGDLSFHVLRFGSGRPTLFLHGGGPGCTGWTDFGQVAALFAAERTVILVDLLQYGRSSKPEVTGPMWDFHAAYLVSLLDALDIECADFVCNSWGGTQALRLAADWPTRVASLTVTGAMPVFHGPMTPLLDRSRRGRIARDRYYGGPDGATNAKMRQLMSDLEWFDGSKIPTPTVNIRHTQSLDVEEMNCGQSPEHRGAWQDLGEHLNKIAAPTLFMWGMYDGFLTPDYALMLASRIEGGRAYVMDRASHHLQEERPEEYHAIVTAFLNQVWAA